MRNFRTASMVVLSAAVAFLATETGPSAQQRGRISGEGFISEGIPKMPNPPGPAPKRDLSGAWVGPGTSNKPDPVPPMTPAGDKVFKQAQAYGTATGQGGGAARGAIGASNDPFITCDPLG